MRRPLRDVWVLSACLASVTTLSACQHPGIAFPNRPIGSLSVRPQTGSVTFQVRVVPASDRHIAAITNLTVADIDHVRFNLLAGATQVDTSAILGANLATKTISFDNLKPSTNYTVKWMAYKSATETAPNEISSNATADSERTVNLGTTPGAMSIAPITVKLNDVLFNGSVAPTGIAVAAGIVQDGVLTTLAGGAAGYQNLSGLAAQFTGPKGMATTTSGDVIVADTGNNRIRRIALNRSVALVAGSGAPSYTDANGVSAAFNQPTAVAVDPANNIFVADQANHRIRRIDTSGNVTTLAGNASNAHVDNAVGTLASFMSPTGLALDAANNRLFVADNVDNRIRVVDIVTTAVTTLAGTGGTSYTDGPGAGAQFFEPIGLAFDNTRNILYVADSRTNTIRRIDLNLLATDPNFVKTVAGVNAGGAPADGTLATARFGTPTDVAIDPRGTGTLYVADYDNVGFRTSLRRIDVGGSTASPTFVSTLTNPSLAGPSDGYLKDVGFVTSAPGGLRLALDNNADLFVADTGGNTIRKVK